MYPWKRHICQLLMITVLLGSMAAVCGINPKCVVDFNVKVNETFTITCKPGKDINPSELRLLKYEGEEELENFTYHHNATHINATHPGMGNVRLVLCWFRHCESYNYFILKTCEDPKKPRLRINETKYFNYEEIELKWDIFDTKDFYISDSYAQLHINGSSISNCTDPNIKRGANTKGECQEPLKAPPGALLSVQLVVKIGNLSCGASSNETIYLDEYVIPGEVKDLNFSQVEPSKAVLQWTPPYSQAALKYTVKYSSKYDIRPKVIQLTNETSITLPDVCANTQYSFTVIAHSLNYKASQPVINNFNTSCSVPGQVQVTSNSYQIVKEEKESISVEIFWKMYLCDYGCEDLQFQLKLYEFNHLRNFVKRYNVSRNLRSKVIKLARHKTYHVTITATNEMGDGNDSDNVIIDTAKYESEPVEFTVIWNIGKVTVHWDHSKKSALYTVYTCDKVGESENLTWTTCSKIFWTEVGDKQEASLKICPKNYSGNSSGLCTGGPDFCRKTQECIFRSYQSKTKIGLGYRVKDSNLISPIQWSNCMYDNTKMAEVPEFNISAKPTSLILKLGNGVSPCKKIGRYFESYAAEIYTNYTTRGKIPVKVVQLNRKEKEYVISQLESSHFYNIAIIGIAKEKRVPIAHQETATTAQENSMAYVPSTVVIGILACTVIVLGVWVHKKKQKKSISMVTSTRKIHQQNDSGTSDSEDEEPNDEKAREAGEYDDIPDMNGLEMVPMVPKKNGIIKIDMDDKLSQGDSAIGDTFSKNDCRGIKDLQKLKEPSTGMNQASTKGIKALTQGITDSTQGIIDTPTVESPLTGKDPCQIGNYNFSPQLMDGCNIENDNAKSSKRSSKESINTPGYVSRDTEDSPIAISNIALSSLTNSSTNPGSSKERLSKPSDASDSTSGFPGQCSPQGQVQYFSSAESPGCEFDANTSESFSGSDANFVWHSNHHMTENKSHDSADDNYD